LGTVLKPDQTRTTSRELQGRGCEWPGLLLDAQASGCAHSQWRARPAQPVEQASPGAGCRDSPPNHWARLQGGVQKQVSTKEHTPHSRLVHPTAAAIPLGAQVPGGSPEPSLAHRHHGTSKAMAPVLRDLCAHLHNTNSPMV
jgi:hypothetical protein